VEEKPIKMEGWSTLMRRKEEKHTQKVLGVGLPLEK
jgi:hypothetical protein